MWKRFTIGLIYFALLLIACPPWVAHPLITDDSGTQGKGKFQLELNGQYDWDKDDTEDLSVRTIGDQAAATLSYEIAENVDLFSSLPHMWGKAGVNEITIYDEKGFGDAVLETKLRSFKKNGFS